MEDLEGEIEQTLRESGRKWNIKKSLKEVIKPYFEKLSYKTFWPFFFVKVENKNLVPRKISTVVTLRWLYII